MGITDWLLKPLGWLFARHPEWRDAFGHLLLWIGRPYYWGLAAVFALIGGWNLLGHPFDNQLAHESFDLLMRQRPIAYPADPDIVVLDIDEASLAAMRFQYGRWPWPREVLGQVAARMEAAGAQAVIFDILFSDEDVANPGSEAAFDKYVLSSRKSFFPAVRLNPANDGASQVTVAMLKFAQPEISLPAFRVNGQRTVALMTPYFKSIYDGARVGISNIYPDADNVVRWYEGYETLGGYRIPSLPYRVGQVLGWSLPVRAHNLINWPKGVAPYRTLGFARVLEAARSNDDAFFAQLSGKVVVVGSTAPDLNDIKATPMDSRYAGVNVLATVVDNLKNNRFLRPLSPSWIWAFELLMLAASAQLFTRTNQALTVAKYFFIVPAVLLAISLLSVSISDLLVDLSVPAAVVLGYFTFAKLFDTNVRGFISGTGPFAATAQEGAGKLQVACLPASVSRAQVLALLAQRGSPLKLWEPESVGLGRHWAAQGWVLWRWFSSSSATPQTTLDIQWMDVVPVEAPGTAFSLATAIASAATAATREKS
ncbi:MAG TPA: CHASE2 domain-containing protein [Steroidobacteraceae bacterium]|jgi:CHASE2 domain-containing sensor protein|nr:CHASE2 domain-containing protein [Steroidobacteraceae bacterium]